MRRLKAGQQWRNVTVVETWTEPSVEGAVRDSHGGPRMVRLRCGCGWEWVVEAEEVEGVAVAGRPRSCGRAECGVGVGKGPGRPVGEDGPMVTVVVGMSVGAVERVVRVMKERGLGKGRAVEWLVRKGWEWAVATGEVEAEAGGGAGDGTVR